jgi:tetratricopeptide (TPR) repeat protein
MSQRLSRKQIKRDEFMESVGGAIEYVRGHLRKLVAAAILLVVAALATAVGFGLRERQSRRADAALAQALQVHGAPIDPDTPDPDDPTAPTFADARSRAQRARELFERVVENHGRSDAARIATVFLATLAVQEGDPERARALWSEFLDRGPDHMLAAEVRVNLMVLDRAEGRGEELVQQLRDMLGSADAGVPPDLLWYQLGLTLEELGRSAEAADAYRRIIEDFPQSAYAAEARSRGGIAAPLPFGS